MTASAGRSTSPISTCNSSTSHRPTWPCPRRRRRGSARAARAARRATGEWTAEIVALQRGAGGAGGASPKSSSIRPRAVEAPRAATSSLRAPRHPRGPICAVEDIDPPWRKPDLKNAVVGREVLLGHLEGFERGAKGGERAIDACGIRRLGAHEHVEILRCPRVTVERDRMSSEHDELGARFVQLDEQVSEVVGQIDQRSRPGTKRMGVSARVYVGSGSPDSDQLSRVSCATSATAAAPETGSRSISVRWSRVRCRDALVLRASARRARSAALIEKVYQIARLSAALPRPDGESGRHGELD